MSDAPDRLVPLSVETANIRTQYGLPDSKFSTFTPERQASYRDEFITARMYAIDMQYSEFETALTRERQQLGFLTTTSIIGLTATSTLINPVGVKDILTAIAAGLTGTKAAFNDEVLLNKTIQVLQNQMRSNRSRKAAVIVSKLGSPISIYPLGLALTDIEEYYQAGTITSAFLEVSGAVAQTAIEERIKKENADALVITTPASDPSYRTLVALLYPAGIDGPINADRVSYLEAALGKYKANLAIYLQDPRYAVLRVEMARCIRAMGVKNKECKAGSLERLIEVAL